MKSESFRPFEACWCLTLLKDQQVRVGLGVIGAAPAAFPAGPAVPQQQLLPQADAAGRFGRAGRGGQPGVRLRRLLPDVVGRGSGLRGRLFADQVRHRERRPGPTFLLASSGAPVFRHVSSATRHFDNVAVASRPRCAVLLLALPLLLAARQLLLADEGRLVGGREEGGRVGRVRRGDHGVGGDHHVLGGLQRPGEALLPRRRWWVQPGEGVKGGEVTGGEGEWGGGD